MRERKTEREERVRERKTEREKGRYIYRMKERGRDDRARLTSAGYT